MRILHILDHSVPVQDGYSHRTLAIIREQRALGWETEHLTSSKHGPVDALEEVVRDVRFFRTAPRDDILGRAPVLGQWMVVHDLTRRLDQLVDKLHPDILHAHSPALCGSAAVDVGQRRGLPVVYEVRGFWEDAAVDQGTSSEWGARYRATRALETRVLRRADAVTTICQGLATEMAGRGIPAGKITQIPNGVDVADFERRGTPEPGLRRELGLEGQLVAGFIGSFYRFEGLHLLIDALPRALERRPELKLLLVGGGMEAQALRQQVEAAGLGDKVVFTGRVPHSEVGRYYDLVDVMVYPRMSMRLTELVTPLKPLEAMARGHIVLASDVGGHRELVSPGETGNLFTPDDPPALADALVSLLGARDSWPAMLEQARAFVVRERTWAASVFNYRAVYEHLAGPSTVQRC